MGEGRKGLGNGEMGGKDYRSCVFPWGEGGVGLLSTGHLVCPKPFPAISRVIKRAVQNNNLPFAVPDSGHWLP